MPTYEYACKACDHRFEIEQSFHDDALTDCPECQGTLRKVFSAAGIIFKGSGWHVKDYAGSSSSKTTTEPAKKPASDTPASPSSSDKTPPAPAATPSS
jgi:putative FmdB family regulatory protein